MFLIDFFYDNYDVITDANSDGEGRVIALRRIVDFVCKMKKATNYIVALLDALSYELEAENVNNTIIDHLMHELEKTLHMRRGAKCLSLLSEENNVSDALRDYGADDMIYMPWWSYCDEWADSYDVFWQCGKKNFDSDIANHAGERLINIYSILLNQMCINPSAHIILSKYETNINEAEVIVIGMSYTRNAIRAEYIDKKLVSLANSSQDLYFDYLCFKDAMSKGDNVKSVIIGLAPYSLRYDLSKTRMDYRVYFYQELFDDSHNNVKMRDELHEYHKQISLLKKIFDSEMIEKLFRRLADISEVEKLERSQKTFIPEEITELEVEDMRKKYDKPYMDTIQENKMILKDYIECARLLGVHVYLFMPPYTKWYKTHWDQRYINEIRNYVYELGEVFDFDLIDLSDIDLPNHYFGDYAHVNNIGAMYIASVINQILNNA